MTQQIEKIQAILRDWTGCNVLLWYYTVSHAHLEIRLHYLKKKGNIHLICEDCRHITAPTGWPEASVKIEESNVKDEGQYRIFDENASFEVICDFVQINENVEPVW
ncbi:MAG: hypothetical protein GY795_46290 [Desulfobacterales bacterium]|nr:hypothetical protein [Desulfobacterales bacterium]